MVTFFPIADVPVFWPILLMYWFVLFFVTMKRQIKHMIKYRYIPFSIGKKVSLVVLPPLKLCHTALKPGGLSMQLRIPDGCVVSMMRLSVFSCPAQPHCR